jgi:hypothetical protein
MEPGFFHVPLPDAEGRGAKSDPPSAAMWICLPYFALQKYSGLLSGTSPSSFPIQTLLQAQYARNTQQRDMLQAVCQSGNAPSGQCFHIAQLWCLVLGNCPSPPVFVVSPLANGRAQRCW